MLIFMHVPKTAGTWLRRALEEQFPKDKRCPLLFEGHYADHSLDEIGRYRFHSAHIGFEMAATLGKPIVTVLREPFDRLVSLYYYWRQCQQSGTQHEVAKRLTLEQFFSPEQRVGSEDFDNGMAWQLAIGHANHIRRNNRDIGDDVILSRALANIESIEVVGVTEMLPIFTATLNRRLGVTVAADLPRANTTNIRPPVESLTSRERDLLYPHVRLDLVVYQSALRRAMTDAGLR